MSPVKLTRFFGVTVLVGLLAACDGEQTELQSWMEQEKAKTPTQIKSVAEPKKYEPFKYESAVAIDPFNNSKLLGQLAKLAPAGKSGLAPDVNRRKEALESFPVDALRMVGLIQQRGKNYALLEVDKLVYTVKVGNFIGQNFGKITTISETEVKLKEIVQDGGGDWIERDTSLQLQDAKGIDGKK
jgi:type IV pilus assembly protein PilP